MTQEQRDLLVQARESLIAGKEMRGLGHHGYAASRAYYAMFHVVQAFLLGKGLAFSKHSAVHAAFGQHFAKTGEVPAEFHRYLIRGMEARHAGDYGKPNAITPEESAEQIARAEQFLELAERLIGVIPRTTC
jgi:uncharacterized protein (UPF0332 family)